MFLCSCRPVNSCVIDIDMNSLFSIGAIPLCYTIWWSNLVSQTQYIYIYIYIYICVCVCVCVCGVCVCVCQCAFFCDMNKEFKSKEMSRINDVSSVTTLRIGLNTETLSTEDFHGLPQALHTNPKLTFAGGRLLSSVLTNFLFTTIKLLDSV